MLESLVLLIVAQVAKPADPVAKPAATKGDATKDSKAPIRLRRRTDGKDQAAPAKQAKADDAPAVERRNIPQPEPAKKKSELDEKLLNELGRALESGQPDDADPLLRAQRRMRNVEEELAKADATTRTIDTQKRIVADLDELLERAANQNNRKQQKQSKSKKKQSQQDMAQQQQQGGSKKNEGNQRNEQAAKDAARRAGAGRNSSEQRGTGREAKDIWGHLSALDHQEMMQYAREHYLPKYERLIEQYYTTIATKSRGKSE